MSRKSILSNTTFSCFHMHSAAMRPILLCLAEETHPRGHPGPQRSGDISSHQPHRVCRSWQRGPLVIYSLYIHVDVNFYILDNSTH